MSSKPWLEEFVFKDHIKHFYVMCHLEERLLRFAHAHCTGDTRSYAQLHVNQHLKCETLIALLHALKNRGGDGASCRELRVTLRINCLYYIAVFGLTGGCLVLDAKSASSKAIYIFYYNNNSQFATCV